MGQVIKYAALGVALVLVLSTVGVIIADLAGANTADGFLGAVSGFVNNVSSYLRSARGVLNYALGSGASVALDILIWLNVLLPIGLIPVRIIITIYRFINQ